MIMQKSTPYSFYYLSIFYCCAWDSLWHLQNFLHYIKYITLEFTPSIILLYHLPHSWKFQQVSDYFVHFFSFHFFVVLGVQIQALCLLPLSYISSCHFFCLFILYWLFFYMMQH
jgi:hypothetical protein